MDQDALELIKIFWVDALKSKEIEMQMQMLQMQMKLEAHESLDRSPGFDKLIWTFVCFTHRVLC